MPPEPIAYLPWMLCMLAPVALPCWLEEADQALKAVLRRDDHEDHGQGHQDQHAAEDPARGADDPRRPQEDDQQDERGAQVVAGHHQQAQHDGCPA